MANETSAPTSSPAERLLLIIAPLALLGGLMVAAWPGYISFDSAFQWHQAQTLKFFDIAPPLLPGIWAVLLGVGFPDTTGPLILILALHVFGFARLAVLASTAGNSRLAWILAICGPLCPFLLSMLPHVWTDLLLSGALLCAFSLLLPGFPLGRSRGISVLLLIVLAGGIRHNGVFAVVPLIFAWGWLAWPDRSKAQRLLIVVSSIALLWLTKVLLAQALTTGRLDTWAVAPMLDLHSVSVATDRQLLPTSVVGPGMDLPQLRAAHDPYWPDLFGGTRSGVANPTIAPFTAVQADDVRKAWLSLLDEPAWWHYRFRLFGYLLGPHREPGLARIAESPELRQYADNRPLARRFPEWHSNYRGLIGSLRQIGALAPGLYLLLGSVGLIVHSRKRRLRAPLSSWTAAEICAVTCMASAWAYTAPYFLLAPAPEARYVLWPALAGWVVFLYCLSGLIPPRTRSLAEHQPGNFTV